MSTADGPRASVPAPAPPSDHYKTLGLVPSCNEEAIRRAYKRLAFQWHPDRNVGRHDEAEERFKAIQEAYATLSDPGKRKIYDHVAGHRRHDEECEGEHGGIDAAAMARRERERQAREQQRAEAALIAGRRAAEARQQQATLGASKQRDDARTTQQAAMKSVSEARQAGRYDTSQRLDSYRLQASREADVAASIEVTIAVPIGKGVQLLDDEALAAARRRHLSVFTAQNAAMEKTRARNQDALTVTTSAVQHAREAQRAETTHKQLTINQRVDEARQLQQTKQAGFLNRIARAASRRGSR